MSLCGMDVDPFTSHVISLILRLEAMMGRTKASARNCTFYWEKQWGFDSFKTVIF